MKDISFAADLSRIYTNNSVRATAITLWSASGLTNREIMAISGYRNESSLKSYNSIPSLNQLRNCSDVVPSALGDNETIRAGEQRQNQIVGCETRPPLQQLPVPLNNTISATQQNMVNANSEYRQMCNSCTIRNVHITLNRRKADCFSFPELNFRKHFTFYITLIGFRCQV